MSENMHRSNYVELAGTGRFHHHCSYWMGLKRKALAGSKLLEWSYASALSGRKPLKRMRHDWISMISLVIIIFKLYMTKQFNCNGAN